jgi:hypothetical protein
VQRWTTVHKLATGVDRNADLKIGGGNEMRNSGSGGYRRGALALVIAFAIAALPVTGTALEHDARAFLGFWARAFLGFWEGVDPLDGSTAQVSISDIGGDGVLEIVIGESFWTLCFELGDNFSLGRGLSSGQGTVVSNGVLEVEERLTCISDDNNLEPPLPLFTSQYTLESQGRILVVPQGDNPDILLHRTAR